MVDLSASINTGKVLKNLDKFFNESIYIAASKAEQRTVKAAQKDAQESMKRTLHKPTASATRAVRFEFRQRGKIKAGIGSARVFVAPYLVDELWPNAITEIGNAPKLETNSPEAGRGIVEPMQREVNAAGNLKGFRNGKLRRLRATEKYFEVSQNDKAQGKFGKLDPGIYLIYGPKRRRKIRMVVKYEQRRYIKPKWPFRQVVNDSFDRNYPKHMGDAIHEEVRKLL